MAASPHEHDHPHAKIGGADRPCYYDIMETGVRDLAREKMDEVQARWAGSENS